MKFSKVPTNKWPKHLYDPKRCTVWLSQDFLVQVFDDVNGIKRVSVNKVKKICGNWEENITWDELQNIKKEIGFGDMWATEIYPAEKHTVNVANMRHLWVLTDEPEYGWKNRKEIENAE
ncbi:MAG: hypothetical protein LBU87_03375 [Lactobacillales bacterium]|jgi:hypothetical protein|nr:hypothetical protein [Lactobacillales bacterium]